LGLVISGSLGRLGRLVLGFRFVYCFIQDSLFYKEPVHLRVFFAACHVFEVYIQIAVQAPRIPGILGRAVRLVLRFRFLYCLIQVQLFYNEPVYLEVSLVVCYGMKVYMQIEGPGSSTLCLGPSTRCTGPWAFAEPCETATV
jgi:hypothetical protein